MAAESRGKGESADSPRRVQAKLRAAEALELRAGGAEYAVIAQRLGYSNPSGAWDAVDRALKATLQEPADKLRKLELRRLDAMWLRAWTRFAGGGLDAGAAGPLCLKIMQRRAELLGLDAPVAHEITGGGGGPIEWIVTYPDKKTPPD